MKRSILAPLLLLAGCIDFVDLTEAPPPAKGYTAQIHLVAQREGLAVDTLRVFGGVIGGHDARAVRFVDDTLRVMDFALPPRRAAGRGERSYNGAIPLAKAAAHARVRLPTVQSFVLPQREFVVPLATLAGPDTLVADATGGFELRVEPGLADPGLVSAEPPSWDVSLLRGNGSAQFSTHGALPDRISIPASLIPRDTATLMRVRFSVRQNWRTPEGAAATIGFGTNSEAVRTVRLPAHTP